MLYNLTYCQPPNLQVLISALLIPKLFVVTDVFLSFVSAQSLCTKFGVVDKTKGTRGGEKKKDPKNNTKLVLIVGSELSKKC